MPALIRLGFDLLTAQPWLFILTGEHEAILEAFPQSVVRGKVTIFAYPLAFRRYEHNRPNRPSLKKKRRKNFWPLLQLRVLDLGLLQDRDVGIGVFPESEEIFVAGERADAGGVRIGSAGGS